MKRMATSRPQPWSHIQLKPKASPTCLTASWKKNLSSRCCTFFRSHRHRLSLTHLQGRDHGVVLAIPAIDVATTPCSSTFFRASNVMCLPSTPHRHHATVTCRHRCGRYHTAPLFVPFDQQLLRDDAPKRETGVERPHPLTREIRI
jgi:hypothetical protein